MNREKIGRALLITGLVSWATLMIIIVTNNLRDGSKPSIAFSIVTVSCWVVFFIGKSLLKTREVRVPDA